MHGSGTARMQQPQPEQERNSNATDDPERTSQVAAGHAGEAWTLVHGDELYCEADGRGLRKVLLLAEKLP